MNERMNEWMDGWIGAPERESEKETQREHPPLSFSIRFPVSPFPTSLAQMRVRLACAVYCTHFSTEHSEWMFVGKENAPEECEAKERCWMVRKKREDRVRVYLASGEGCLPQKPVLSDRCNLSLCGSWQFCGSDVLRAST